MTQRSLSLFCSPIALTMIWQINCGEDLARCEQHGGRHFRSFASTFYLRSAIIGVVHDTLNAR